MSLDGLRRGEVVLVSYEADEWWHERSILGFVGADVCVVTPHWDLYVEAVTDYASLHRLGARGGGVPAAATRSGRIVRFNRAELQRRWPGLLRRAERAEANLQEEPPAAAGAGAADRDTVWVAMEDRGGHALGDPVDVTEWEVQVFEDRGVAKKGNVRIAVAKLASWKPPEPPKAAAPLPGDVRTLAVKYDQKGARS